MNDNSNKTIIIIAFATLITIVVVMVATLAFVLLKDKEPQPTPEPAPTSVATAVAVTPTVAPAPIITPSPTAVPTVQPVVTATPTATPAPKDHTIDEVNLHQIAYNSVYGFTQAVNTGDFSYASQYLDPSSSFYNSQRKAIESIHNQGITEELQSCSISDIRWIDDNTCTMVQNTVIRCYYPDKDPRDVKETYTYKLRRSGNIFVYVSQTK